MSSIELRELVARRERDQGQLLIMPLHPRLIPRALLSYCLLREWQHALSMQVNHHLSQWSRGLRPPHPHQCPLRRWRRITFCVAAVPRHIRCFNIILRTFLLVLLVAYGGVHHGFTFNVTTLPARGGYSTHYPSRLVSDESSQVTTRLTARLLRRWACPLTVDPLSAR